ncbi:MAG: hypothetical protein JWL75_352 [Parcubacteria group bacterium]|nr:hypothetical protein [Parcubacteria group bacterium]
MSAALFHAGHFQGIGCNQIGFHSRTATENYLQILYDADERRGGKAGPYMILAAGAIENVFQLERILKPPLIARDVLEGREAVWNFNDADDARYTYKILTSLGSVNVWIFVKSEYAREFGDTFLRPAA